MSQVDKTTQQSIGNKLAPVQPEDPNQLVAISLYYPSMVPAFIGLCVVVLVAAFSKDFPSGFLIWKNFSLQGIIAALSVLSAFLFIEATRMGFFAHSNDLYGMDKERRKSAFDGYDPLQEGIKNTDWFDWSVIVKIASARAKTYQIRALGNLQLGLIALFLSVSFLLAPYVLWLGISAFVLTCMYTSFQLGSLTSAFKQYRCLTKCLRELEKILPPIHRSPQEALPPWIESCVKAGIDPGAPET